MPEAARFELELPPCSGISMRRRIRPDVRSRHERNFRAACSSTFRFSFPYTIFDKNGVCSLFMARTNIDIDEDLIRKARKLTRLKTKRQIVDKALELLVRSESRKGILRYYGRGVWRGDLKASRRNRA